jgi:Zn-dependent protease with chaperone function
VRALPRSAAFGGSVSSWFSTHPPIPERIKRLEEIAAEL